MSEEGPILRMEAYAAKTMELFSFWIWSREKNSIYLLAEKTAGLGVRTETRGADRRQSPRLGDLAGNKGQIQAVVRASGPSLRSCFLTIALKYSSGPVFLGPG